MPIKIFFADDDPDDVELLREGLRGVFPDHILYYETDCVQVTTTANAFLPDLIFLDYNMPKLTGSECLKQIKRDRVLFPIPVVMYSTSSYQSHITECFKNGAARFLIKPVDYIVIFKGLEIILDLFRKGQLVTPSSDQFVIDTHKMS